MDWQLAKKWSFRSDSASILYVEVSGGRPACLNKESCTALLFVQQSPMRFDGNVHAVESRHEGQDWAVEFHHSGATFKRKTRGGRLARELRTEVTARPIQ